MLETKVNPDLEANRNNGKNSKDTAWFRENFKGLKQVYRIGYVAIYDCKVIEYAMTKRHLNKKIEKYNNRELFYIVEIV